MAGTSRDFGKLALRVNAEYSPDDFGRGKSLFVELGPILELADATKMSATIGRRERERSLDYISFNAGLSWVFRQKLTVDARYYDTNRGEIGRPFKARVVLSARLTL